VPSNSCGPLNIKSNKSLNLQRILVGLKITIRAIAVPRC
jgi:hypothetical protein